MEPYLTTDFGNPSGSHTEARRARRAVDDAREELASLLGADFGEIIFTSGGTEADNLAVFGSAGEEAGSTARQLVCTAIEHPAVLAACRARAERFGVRLSEVGADKDGTIDLDALDDTCDEDVAFVSVMAVNNELGTVQPLEAVAEVVRRRAPFAVFHTDAVQAAPWLDVANHAAVADLVAISAHKFGGPKGVGALVARNGTTIRPLLFGGGQERERRSGTIQRGRRGGNGRGPHRHCPPSGGDQRRSGSAPRSIGRTGSAAPYPARTRPAIGNRARPVTCTCASPVSRTSPSFSCSTRPAWPSPPGPPARAVPPSRVTCCSPWVSTRLEAASGIRFSLGPTTSDEDVDRALRAVPDAVARLRG